ncbi:MAG: Lipopolysaccharide heptosyltransferase III [Parcubacteria group bacterium LiPW_41]|nr:MAG: Lipopolysaccharide heptosyltransferase III [Parcubacteria group bacterium LiPW_41]
MEFIRKYKSLFISLRSNVVRKKFLIQKTIVKWIKIVFLVVEIPFELVGDALFFWRRCLKKKFINPQKILIVRIDQFGDVLFSTFLLPILKKKYPECEIDYLVNPKTLAILKNNQYIQNVYLWDEIALHFIAGRKEGSKTSISQALKNNQEVIKKLRGENYDYVINGRAFVPSSNIWWKFIKPKRLIAFDISEQSFLADYWAEYGLKSEEWENYMNLLLPLGIAKNEFFYEPVFNNFDDSIFNKYEFQSLRGKNYIVCAPVSFDKDRQWEVESWRKVIVAYRDAGNAVVFTGIQSQLEYIKNILDGVDGKDIIVATNLTLPELGSIYKKAKLFLGIESFPAHLALALKKPIICLMRNDAYYLKGFSSAKTASARSMIPLLEGRVFALDIKTTSVEKVVEIVKSL